MLGWWKAIDPGEFHMGSEEYWRQAFLSDSEIPKGPEQKSTASLLTVKNIMPMPWKLLDTSRSGNPTTFT
jgi:hypothetical protein